MGKCELTVVHILHSPLFRTLVLPTTPYFGSPRDIQSSLPTESTVRDAEGRGPVFLPEPLLL
jgi:hypothetical protein